METDDIRKVVDKELYLTRSNDRALMDTRINMEGSGRVALPKALHFLMKFGIKLKKNRTYTVVLHALYLKLSRKLKLVTPSVYFRDEIL